jgi:hypothetical protein
MLGSSRRLSGATPEICGRCDSRSKCSSFSTSRVVTMQYLPVP